MNSTRGVQNKLTEANGKTLSRYFRSLGINDSLIKNKPNNKLEKTLYEPLKEYLDESGLYDIVENRANLHNGKKWQNADLVATKIHNLSYHIGIFPKLTGIEVKINFPSVTDIQQAASYLRYCNSAYLCFFDKQYKGRDTDELMTRLRDDGIWDLAAAFSIGLIVAFNAQEKSSKFKFQILKEAPDNPLDPHIVEEGIEMLLSSDAKKELSSVLNSQIQTLIFKKMHDV